MQSPRRVRPRVVDEISCSYPVSLDTYSRALVTFETAARRWSSPLRGIRRDSSCDAKRCSRRPAAGPCAAATRFQMLFELVRETLPGAELHLCVCEEPLLPPRSRGPLR